MSTKNNKMKTVLILICLVITAVSANADLIHHWEFDVDATDSVGSANGSLQGSAAITTGSLGKYAEAVSLDGASGTNVDISGGAIIPTSAFTLTVWVKQADSSSYRNVMGSQTSGSTGAFIRIDSGVVKARTLPQNGSVLLSDTAVLPLNTWTHIAFTYDSTDAVSGVKLYVDGTQVDSAGATAFTDSPYFRIGARGDSAINPFAGLIDDARIYDTALSASKIAAVMGDPTIATVEAGSDWVTWSGQPVTLADVVVVNNDTGAGDLTLEWTAIAPAGVSVSFSDTSIAQPEITVTKPIDGTLATVECTLTVTQPGKNPVASSMQIDVYDNACEAGQAVGYTALDATDFNFDCVTDIEDLVIMAAAWLVEYQADSPLPN